MKLIKLGKYSENRAKNVVLIFGAEQPSIEAVRAIADDPERDILFVRVNADNARSTLVALDTPWETFLYGNIPSDLADLGQVVT